LRWGHTTKGTFTIKEAYDIQARHHMEKNMEGRMVAQGYPFPLDGLQRVDLDLGSIAEKGIPRPLLLLALSSTQTRHGAYTKYMLVCGVEVEANARSL